MERTHRERTHTDYVISDHAKQGEVDLSWSHNKLSCLYPNGVNSTWVIECRIKYQPASMYVSTKSARYVEQYLAQHSYLSPSFGDIDPNAPLLAFSFGESQAFNHQLAKIVIELLRDFADLKAFLQWEIAEWVLSLCPEYMSRVQSISPKPLQEYFSTQDVIERVLKLHHFRQVNLVAQLWHANRSIVQLERAGVRCISLRGIDEFSDNDPQQWVRHPLPWLVREARVWSDLP